MASPRSSTGCLACKIKRKKCDETKPHCLRCQKSRVECPGYIYIQDPNKPKRRPRTLPAPRTTIGRTCTKTDEGISLASTEEVLLGKQDQSSRDYNSIVTSSSGLSASVLEDKGTPAEYLDRSNQWASSTSCGGSYLHHSVDFGNSPERVNNAINSSPNLSPPGICVAKPLTTGQASLLEALFSLARPPDIHPAPHHSQPIINLLPNANLPLILSSPSSEAKRQDDVASHEDKKLEDLGVSVLRRQLVPDRTLESNALPFILQSYATWVSRMAFEPLRLESTAREFVLNQFEDEGQSRLIIVLLANVGRRIGSVDHAEGNPNRMLSMLQSAVRQRLGAALSCNNPKRPELTRALDSALETMVIHFSVSPMGEVITLRDEAAPIFRKLCPDPPDAPINLHLLLKHPQGCLRHYAEIDIVFSALTDMPMSFQYEATTFAAYYERSVSAIQDDGIVQWLHGVPNEIILLFAKMKVLRQDGLTPPAMIGSLERDIYELQPHDGSSSERFVAIMRSVVQECWRQAAFIYLYMAVCGDPCNTPRVKEAYKRFMRLLNGTKPGRLPDEFLIAPLLIISPAAQRQNDREVIRQRALGLQRRGQTVRANINMMCIVEDYWARVDAEERPIMWSDVAVSRRKLLGV